MNITKIIKALVVIALAAGISFLAYKEGIGQVLTVIKDNREAGIAISLAAYAVLGATVVPSEPLTLLLTAVYGPVTAIIVCTIGNTLATLVEYAIGGSIGDLADFEARKARLPFGLGRLPISSPVFLLLGRMIPGFGSKFVSLAAGIYKVPMFRFVWTAIASNLFGALLVALPGYGLFTWISRL